MDPAIDLLDYPRPELDPDFVPAALWNRAYRERVAGDPGAGDLPLALERPDGTVFAHRLRVLAREGPGARLNTRYVERFVKALLWIEGGSRLYVGGQPELAAELTRTFGAGGPRAFDSELVGRKVFGEAIEVRACAPDEVPDTRTRGVALGRNLGGCRIGFDLGGSDRKGAALIDGQVVHSEEVAWDPYFQADPDYHYEGIQDTLRRAAAALPRVDAIGGSAAGIYVDNEVRVASLFRGVSETDFERGVRDIFARLRREWGGVPFEVVNDGEVTALAGSMSLGDDALLGISMGTSLAAGYCDPKGHITQRLNELAFAPVDYRADAPADEWSRDLGCGVQYFSQQGVARLAPLAGIELPETMPFAERLVQVQGLMAAGDDRARSLYRTIGTCFGYSIAHWAELYELRNLLILGRVTSGEGGQLILEEAARLLGSQFPELAETIALRTPDETDKRHGQAIAAASLPALATPNPS